MFLERDMPFNVRLHSDYTNTSGTLCVSAESLHYSYFV
jgi:hypothetical protein